MSKDKEKDKDKEVIEKKLLGLGLTLPTVPASKGIYKRCLVDGRHLYVSGHVSINADGSYITGKLGKDLTEDQGREAAKQCGLAILASIKEKFGTLDKVKRVIKILGMVNAVPEYDKHPIVINGCSELFAQLWGEDGIGVRSAVGMGSLPNNVSVEIEALFEI
jgi:enamine deaminase RidA (YjgF/YER057c/UK114 family)